MKKFDDFIEYIGKITTNKITFDQLYDMYDIYTAVSKEDGRNRFEDESLIGAILNDTVTGFSKDEVYANVALNRHLDYFDNFMGEGTKKKVLKALVDYKLPSDILRGLKPEVDHKGEPIRLDDGRIVTVTQKVERPSNGSPEIVFFEIRVRRNEADDEGIAVFTFSKDTGSEELEKEELSKFYESLDKLLKDIESEKKSKRSLGYIDEIEVIGGDYNKVRYYTDKNGNIRIAGFNEDSTLPRFFKRGSENYNYFISIFKDRMGEEYDDDEYEY